MIRIIGDVHAKFRNYLDRIIDVNSSIQIGDFGFAKDWYKLILHGVDYKKHKIIPGNHDDYNGIRKEYTFNKDYGKQNFHNFNFFFVRGAWSIDQDLRLIGISWWKEEELSQQELQNAIDDYSKVRPDIVITHDCPGDHTGISTSMFLKTWYPNRTSLALQNMWNIHHPKLWIFGHWHKNLVYEIQGTTFICLDELNYIDYDTNKDVDWNIKSIRKQMKKLKTGDFISFNLTKK